MKMQRNFGLPLVIVIIGIAWLLNVAKVISVVDWLWVIGLAVIGVVILCGSRLSRGGLVGGGLFLSGAALSLLRQLGVLAVGWVLPLLVIACGLLIFFAQFLPEGPESDK